MDTVARLEKAWTAEEFLKTDQDEFGDAWRYELVDGVVVAMNAPSPEHAAIQAGLVGALAARLKGRADKCRPESGSGAAPRNQQRATARIPDATIRCGNLPRVLFEVISLSELRAWRARDRKRFDLQDVEGVTEIVELYQEEAAAHVYRREADGSWSFEAVGPDGMLDLVSVTIKVPMTEVYEFADLPERPGDGE